MTESREMTFHVIDMVEARLDDDIENALNMLEDLESYEYLALDLLGIDERRQLLRTPGGVRAFYRGDGSHLISGRWVLWFRARDTNQ